MNSSDIFKVDRHTEKKNSLLTDNVPEAPHSEKGVSEDAALYEEHTPDIDLNVCWRR